MSGFSDERSAPELAGSAARTDGRKTAGERIAALLDDGSFVELMKYVRRSNAAFGLGDVSAVGEGAVCGHGTIDTRPVFIAAQDISVLNGSMGAAQADKLCRVIELGMKSGAPVVLLLDSGGARVQEGAAALDGFGRIYKKLAQASGVVPTICAVMGKAMGSAAFIAALCDFTFMVEDQSAMMLFGPNVYRPKPGHVTTGEGDFGAKIHYTESGLAQFTAADEDECFLQIKTLLSMLPSNNVEEAPYELPEDDPLREIDLAKCTGALSFIEQLADDSFFFEVGAGYGQETITGFMKLGGNTVGVISNVSGEPITSAAAKKAARFVRFLDAYTIPLVSLIDSEGAEVCRSCETHGMLSEIAGLVYALAESTMPKLSVITGKAIGTGYTATATKAAGADIVFAWGSAKIAAMDSDAGAIIMFEDVMKTADTPESGRAAAKVRFEEVFASPAEAARQGLVDDIILPAKTRAALFAALEAAMSRREQAIPKKHGVMPL